MTIATASTTSQPEAGVEMSVAKTSIDTARSSQEIESEGGGEHRHGLVSRLRGGGAAKACFIDALACFMCFDWNYVKECCEGCCDCIAGIICCPCEVVCDMCC
ncbi:hypothetical protein FA13DRAFT_56416 [Coprinellus micaceus]|uniref:Uncharacterized protein n=1 Tax=Coprinellus micaceus TaxID=71717 RepID=A0A4Y7U126_COPMI|nr:hypothetical protein FA13DRAFT_56416 [Coprinellus micaceus]